MLIGRMKVSFVLSNGDLIEIQFQKFESSLCVFYDFRRVGVKIKIY